MQYTVKRGYEEEEGVGSLQSETVTVRVFEFSFVYLILSIRNTCVCHIKVNPVAKKRRVSSLSQ